MCVCGGGDIELDVSLYCDYTCMTLYSLIVKLITDIVHFTNCYVSDLAVSFLCCSLCFCFYS